MFEFIKNLLFENEDEEKEPIASDRDRIPPHFAPSDYDGIHQHKEELKAFQKPGIEYTDEDEAALKQKFKDNFSAASGNYFPKVNDYIPYRDYAMNVHEDVKRPQITAGMAAIFDNTGARKMTGGGIDLLRSIKLIEFIQKPYKDIQLSRHEAAVRRNWAIQTAIGVREFFMFAEPSKIIVELNESQTYGMDEAQKQEIIELLKKELKGTPYDIDLLIKLTLERDQQLKLVSKLSTAYWQVMTFGDAYVLKIFKHDENDIALDTAASKDIHEIEKLYPINSRRVSELIADPKNNMSIEGAWIDGQALDKNSMIQFHYHSHQISAHTEGYGYTPLESILNLAEGLNIFYEEDIKEIQRSAWLSSLLLTINTAGLTRSQATSRVKSVVDSIAPGKIIGIGGQGENGVQAESLALTSNLTGLAEIGENQESKIYRALRVPQFLVQSEDMANRATADKSAELFLSGVIKADQKWLSDILEDQWYEPFIRQKLGLDEDQPLPFKIRREFDTPMVSEFTDLADGLTKLVAGGIWDVEMANEKLGTPEVGDRMQNQMDAMPEESRDASMKFGDKEDVKELKGKELATAVASMKYIPSVKSRATSAGLSAQVKTSKVKLINAMIKKLEETKKVDKNE